MPSPPTIPVASIEPIVGAVNIPAFILIEQLFNVDPSLIECLRALALEVQNSEVKLNQFVQSQAAANERFDRSWYAIDLMLMGG